MPHTQSAQRKLRQDQKRTQIRSRRRVALKKILKAAREGKTEIALVQKALDKAAQRHLIHPNQAARLKSRLMTKMS